MAARMSGSVMIGRSIVVDAAVERALDRTQQGKLPLLQFHTWDYCDGPGTWLQQLRRLANPERVERIGLTNVDTEQCAAERFELERVVLLRRSPS